MIEDKVLLIARCTRRESTDDGSLHLEFVATAEDSYGIPCRITSDVPADGEWYPVLA